MGGQMKMKRLFLGVVLTATLNIVITPSAVAQPGALDPSFDGDGKVTTDFGNFGVEALAVQANGSIVVAGTAGGNFAVARYKRDGSLDASFDADGKVTTDFGASDEAQAVAVRQDGKIVVAGLSAAFPISDFAIARYNRDGSLDASFDADGKVTTDFGAYEVASAVAVRPDGHIVVGGFRAGPDFSVEDWVLARYERDGSLDSGFDLDGKVVTDFASTSFERLVGLAFQPDGRIVAAGSIADSFFALARYNGDGSLDNSFDQDGKVITAFETFAAARAVALQPGGKIVVLGSGGFDFLLARYHGDGTLDTSFDSDGKVRTDFGQFENASAVDVQRGGTIVAAGSSTLDFAAFDFALALYRGDGSLDTEFDLDGKVTTDFGGNDTASEVAFQADGRIVAAGSSGGDFALARYLRR